MGISLDGLSSGLDTTALINALMASEAQPQTQLKAQVSSTNGEISLLQALNTKIAALADLAKTTSTAGALDLYAATTSSTGVSATTSAGASSGELQVVVGALAQGQVGVSAAMTSWPSPPTVTIVGHDGTAVEIAPASSSLDDVVSAINASAAGIVASKVAAGTDASGTAQYRLQFASKTTGASSDFSVYQGSAAQVTANTATNLLTAPGSAITKTAQDASMTLWAGTAAAQVVTSSTNTFTNLLPGVSATVSAVSASPVTITVARDDNAMSSSASKLVDSLAAVFKSIADQSTVSTTTGADGKPTTRAGAFAGDSAIRDLHDQIMSAAALPINGFSPAEYGINVASDGTISFDPDKFAAALAADPATVTSAIQTIAQRVSAVASQVSDKYTGTLTAKITGDQSQVTSLGRQISDWDTRLADRRATLEHTYSAMEVALSNLKSQQASLTSQLSSLSTSSSSGN